VFVVRGGREHRGLLEAGVDVEEAQEDGEQHGVVGGGRGALELVRLGRLGALEDDALDARDRLQHEVAHERSVRAVERVLDEVARVLARGLLFGLVLGHKVRARHHSDCGRCAGDWHRRAERVQGASAPFALARFSLLRVLCVCVCSRV